MIESILSYAGFRYKKQAKHSPNTLNIDLLHYNKPSSFLSFPAIFCGSHNLNGILIAKNETSDICSIFLSQAQTNAKKCDDYEA